MRDSLRHKTRLLQGAALLCLLLAGCAQPISVPSGGPPTPIVLRTPPPTATPVPPAPIPALAPPAPPSVYVALYPQSLAALDASTGAIRWSIPLEPVASLALVNNVLYVGTTTSLYALNALDGSTRWHANQGSTIVGLEVQNNIIYIVSRAGSIQALNASDGEVRWGESTGFELDSLTLDGDRLFASSKVGSLAAWDIKGDSLWLEQASEYSYSRVVASNGMLFLAENQADPSNPALPHLAAFSRDGQPLWDIVPGHGGILTAPVATTDGMLYIADSQGMYAIDPLKGTPRWLAQTDTINQSAQHALAAASNLVILCLTAFLSSQTFQGQVLAFSQGEGKPFWQASLEIGTKVSSSSCQAMGGLFIVEALGRLYALNSTNGNRLWENPLDDSASPIMALG